MHMYVCVCEQFLLSSEFIRDICTACLHCFLLTLIDAHTTPLKRAQSVTLLTVLRHCLKCSFSFFINCLQMKNMLI